MLCFLITTLLFQLCMSQDWPDSYIEAYKESEGAVYDGPYPVRMPMQMRPNMTTTPTQMMPLILQIIMIVSRIMLKMTIFKMIVKFIAVLCLFLFIPTLRLPRASRRSGKVFVNHILNNINGRERENNLTVMGIKPASFGFIAQSCTIELPKQNNQHSKILC